MGQGCNQGYSNYFQKFTPDTDIKYTGVPIPSLGICTGDSLQEIESVLLQKIVDYASGTGITIQGIDLTAGSCATLFTDCITCCNSCTDLPCLLSCYHTAICTIYTEVSNFQAAITSMNSGYNTACLTGVDSTSNLHAVMQELITEFCNLLSAFNVLNSSMSGFTAGINNTIGTFLLNHITTCTGNGSVIKSGSGSTAQIAFTGFVPVGGIIPFAGPIAGRFDSTGLGISGTDMCSWALCNGNNGTINMMGQVPVGLTSMGGSNPPNLGTLSVTVLGIQQGQNEVTLGAAQVPSLPVSGSITDPGHDHTFNFWRRQGNLNQGGGPDGYMDNTPGGTSYTPSVSPPNAQPSGSLPGAIGGGVVRSYTGISLAGATATGGGGSHTNMQPYTGLYYIQRIN